MQKSATDTDATTTETASPRVSRSSSLPTVTRHDFVTWRRAHANATPASPPSTPPSTERSLATVTHTTSRFNSFPNSSVLQSHNACFERQRRHKSATITALIMSISIMLSIQRCSFKRASNIETNPIRNYHQRRNPRSLVRWPAFLKRSRVFSLKPTVTHNEDIIKYVVGVVIKRHRRPTRTSLQRRPPFSPII